MDVQKIAQGLVDELTKEMGKAEENVTLIKGAIEGVNLLYVRLKEEHERLTSNEDSKPAAPQKKTRGRKKKAES